MGSGRLRRSLPVLLVLFAVVAPAASADRRAVLHVSATQELVSLLSAHQVRLAPVSGSTAFAQVPAAAPITGERTTLPVLAHSGGWLKVRLPGRPNGHTGWIRRAGTTVSATRWHIVVRLSRRQVSVYWGGHLVQVFAAVVGKPSTPTPAGEFFVEESVALPASAAGGPDALALSARSDVLQEFDGGPGQIALHGMANLGGVLGTAGSHGCVRLAATAITWLVDRLRPGVPVTITRN